MRALLIACCGSLLATCSTPPTLLQEVRALGELRVVTRSSPTTYYLGARGPQGPEFELIQGFARFLGVELKLTVVDRFGDLLGEVESGRAHVAAAGLTVTPERARRVAFGPGYQTVHQYLVYRRGRGKPRSLDDLHGRRVEVVADSSYADQLRTLQAVDDGIAFRENPTADVAELLLAVSRGELDYTVADSNLFKIYRNLVPEIRLGFELSLEDTLAWAFPRRPEQSLEREAAHYLDFIRANGDLERIMDRYYGHTSRFNYVGTRRLIRDYRNKLPAYREYFETAAKSLGMDWRLLAAIGYQESHWDPEAVSPTGVRGIMMLTENTASVMGVADRVDPAQSIAGGAEYLARLKRQFPPVIREPDRTWFALAAYNIGLAHVQDARELTEQFGQDPNLWVHVRENFQKLSQRRWYSQTANGYAPGWEPVMYVENVRNYFDILVWLTRGLEAPVPPGLQPPAPSLPATTIAARVSVQPDA